MEGAHGTYLVSALSTDKHTVAVSGPMSHGLLVAEPGVKPWSQDWTPSCHCNQFPPSF